MTATPQIPDSFSSDDLQALLENAVSEETAQAEAAASNDDAELTQDEIVDCAVKHLNAMTEEIHDPLVHKAALIQILTNMVGWHTTVGQNNIEAGDIECGTAWLRDAGKFQAMMNIAYGISLGSNDYWCDQKG